MILASLESAGTVDTGPYFGKILRSKKPQLPGVPSLTLTARVKSPCLVLGLDTMAICLHSHCCTLSGMPHRLAFLIPQDGRVCLICPRLVLLRHLTCVSPQQTTEEVHEWVWHAYTFTLPKNCGLHSPELARGGRKSSLTILDIQSIPQKNVYEGPWLENL